MPLAITGATGFVGRALVARYPDAVALDSGTSITDADALAAAFAGRTVIAHCVGVNREVGANTFDRVHREGTAAVIEAAKRAGVQKVVFVSFLRARPGTGWAYHESKWAAEQLLRASGLDYTILKPGIISGRGDHLITRIAATVRRMPVFATVGLRSRLIAPVALEDFTDVMVAAIEGRMPRQTVAVVGPEPLTLGEAVRRIAGVLGRPVATVPLPVWAVSAIARLTPLVTRAQVRMLSESLVEATPPCDALPPDLEPGIRFTDEQIIAAAREH